MSPSFGNLSSGERQSGRGGVQLTWDVILSKVGVRGDSHGDEREV